MNQEKQQAETLVSSFMKKGMVSSARNKAGNIVWPLHKKFFQGVMIMAPVLAVSSAPLAAALFGGGLVAERLLSSHIKFLQNMTLANAARFGRTMVAENVPESVRQSAMEQFLHKAGPLFTAAPYIKQNPEMMARLENGQMVPRLVSLSDIMERKLNRELRVAEKNGQSRPSFKRRWEVYKEAFHEFREAKRQTNKQSLFQKFENSRLRTAPQQGLVQTPDPVVTHGIAPKSINPALESSVYLAARAGSRRR